MKPPENKDFPGSDFDQDPSASDLADLHGRAFAQGGAWSAESFERLLADPLVRTLRHGPAFGMIRVLPDEAELLTLATAPESQGEGHGGAVLAALHDMAEAAGACRMVLEVAKDNTPARALYKRFDYHQIGLRTAYYKRKNGPVDALILSCVFSGSETG